MGCTSFIEIKQGSELSSKMGLYQGAGGYESSGGPLVNLKDWSAGEQSIINYANNGSAVISKAAGNDYGTAVGAAKSNGRVDYLNSALANSKSAIFVGSLNKNGTRQALPLTRT